MPVFRDLRSNASSEPQDEDFGCCGDEDRRGMAKLLGAFLQPEKDAKALAYIDNDFGWSLRLEHHSANLPIKVLHVVGQHNPGNLAAWRQRDFERIALHLTRNRARDGEARLRVVGARREDQGGTTAALLVTRLRITRRARSIHWIRDRVLCLESYEPCQRDPTSEEGAPNG